MRLPQELEKLDLRHPIGIFDSGVGGLTVLQALHRKLPNRDFIYFADTARFPYGRKPKEMVAEFAGEITTFLVDLGVEAIVVACNTASQAALPKLSDQTPLPVWGVIEPGVEAAARATKTGLIGVIGTNGTIASGAYQKRLEARGFTVWARACPLFVHLVEEGLADSEEAALLCRHYLKDRPEIDTLVLGCTHYPLLRGALQQAAGTSVRLVESAETTAEAVRESFADDVSDGTGQIVHVVTGDPLSYKHTARAIGDIGGRILRIEQEFAVNAEITAHTV